MTETTGSSTSAPIPDRYILVTITELLAALEAYRLSLVNERKRALAKKNKAIAEDLLDNIRKADAQIALLRLSPKNRSVPVGLHEADLWGFGLMPNGRWPKL